MIFVLDNYDSFTYNLVQYLGELGAQVEVRRNDEISIADLAKMGPQKIVISPGPCTPQEAGISIEVIRRFSGKVPILGVCLGHQAIASAFGGKIVRAPTLMHGKTSEIAHDSKGVFRGVASPLVATRYHSLMVEEASCPRELEITARSADDENIIMGLRHKKFAIEGVQFHPESVLTQSGKQMIQNFLHPEARGQG